MQEKEIENFLSHFRKLRNYLHSLWNKCKSGERNELPMKRDNIIGEDKTGTYGMLHSEHQNKKNLIQFCLHFLSFMRREKKKFVDVLRSNVENSYTELLALKFFSFLHTKKLHEYDDHVPELQICRLNIWFAVICLTKSEIFLSKGKIWKVF